jgi:hypothetical protein
MSQKYRSNRAATSPEDEAHKDRQHLLEANFHLVEQAYRGSKGEGVVNPVIFVVDGRDEIGREIVRIVYGEEEAAASEAKLTMQRLIPTSVFAMPFAAAVTALESHAPRSAEAVRKGSRPGYIWVGVIASGGTMMAQVPFRGQGKSSQRN